MSTGEGRSDAIFLATLILGLTVLHLAYFVLLQMRSGRTPGKRLVGIRVVDAAGGVPSTGPDVCRRRLIASPPLQVPD